MSLPTKKAAADGSSTDPPELAGMATVLAIAVLAGVALGVVDFTAQRSLPYPWANLANSSAVWAVYAFAVAARCAQRAAVAILMVIVALIVAVASYRLTAVLIEHDSWTTLTSSATVLWWAFAVVAGAVFGLAGAWASHGSYWERIVGSAVPVATLIAESAVLLRHQGALTSWNDNSSTAVLELALALALLVILSRTARQSLLTLLAAMPLAAVGFAAFSVAGFQGFGA